MAGQWVSFDDCMPRLVSVLREVMPEADLSKARIVRDLHGRLHLVVPDAWPDNQVEALRPRLHAALGRYSPGETRAVAKFSETLAGAALSQEPCLTMRVSDTAMQVVERRAVGQDWAIQPGPSQPRPRFVFHSVKGGVGRSTALMLWGRERVRRNDTVLLVDLDLEAPGLGAHMLAADGCPEYGVLDWLVEDLVGNATGLPPLMVANSPVVDRPGLRVAPALGRRTIENAHSVVSKLARAYLEGEDESGFAKRLRRMVALLESEVHPDVTLIDSRAGLHETVAANLLHLEAEVFLFAVDTPATWEGYRALFAHLGMLATAGKHPDWRQLFHMVQARASLTEQDKRRFASRAYSVWVDTLYDELPPGADIAETAFSFDEFDLQAPHWPLAILRSDQFEAFNPMEHLATVGERAIEETFGELFDGLDECLRTIQAERK